MRVYFDTSILIASLLSPKGGSSLLLQYVKKKRIVGIISKTVIEEIVEEDKYKKLKKTKQEIEEFIYQSGLMVRDSITLDEILPYRGKVDAEDAHLVAGAFLTKCVYLVTLDRRHLLCEDIKDIFLPLKIVSPKELLKEFIA